MEEFQSKITNYTSNLKEKDEIIEKLIIKNELLVSYNKDMWLKYKNTLIENKSLLNDYKK